MYFVCFLSFFLFLFCFVLFKIGLISFNLLMVYKITNLKPKILNHIAVTSIPASTVKCFGVKNENNHNFYVAVLTEQTYYFNRPFQMRAWSCITSYPLRGLPYLAYDNVNPAVVNSMLHSSMHNLKRSIIFKF